MKPPEWHLENAVAYVTVKHARAGKDVASRINSRGLGNARTQVVTLTDIELALGFSLAAPSDDSIKARRKRAKVAVLSEPPNCTRKEKIPEPIKGTYPNCTRKENPFSLSQTAHVSR